MKNELVSVYWLYLLKESEEHPVQAVLLKQMENIPFYPSAVHDIFDLPQKENGLESRQQKLPVAFHQEGASFCFGATARTAMDERLPDRWLRRVGPTNWALIELRF
jgi:hypothetical protein